MLITRERAIETRELHEDWSCTGQDGKSPRKAGPYRWRRNGRTQTWKTRPTEWRMPVKFGLYTYASVTDGDYAFHAIEDCPRDAS